MGILENAAAMRTFKNETQFHLTSLISVRDYGKKTPRNTVVRVSVFACTGEEGLRARELCKHVNIHLRCVLMCFLPV